MTVLVQSTTQLLLGANFGDAGEVERLLNVLESERNAPPTHWGAARGLRDPYDRDAILNAIKNAAAEGMTPSIKRSKKPFRYAITWYGGEHVQSLLSLNLILSDGAESADMPAWLSLIDRIAAAFVVDYGHVDLFLANQSPTTRMSRDGSYDHLGYYWRFGLPTLFARNYFGPRLLEIAPELDPTVKTLGLPHALLPSGSLRVDLLAEPWTADPAQLKDAQSRIHSVLSTATGLFARDDHGSWEALPGRRWQSPTDEAFDKLRNRLRLSGEISG